MTRSSYKSGLIALLVVLMAACGASVFAQGGGSSTTLSGIVSDTSGGIMPGVDVVAKNNGTGNTYTAVTDGNGRFSIPALPPGTYSVTVALSGFKTVVLPDVTLMTNVPQTVKVTLEVGQLQETVVVTGAAEVVQAQSAEVQTVVSIKQMNSLPVIARTALDYVVSLPGIETGGSNTRGSTINGLPLNAMNITLDGVNVQDKRSTGEGFFMYIRPLMDSVEEITVSTSNPGAESSGSGASQIRMTTRAGTNRFSGSVYDTWRNQAGTTAEDVIARQKSPSWLWGMNTPNWFNKRDLPKTAAGDYFIDDVRLQTPGFRVGGPIMKDKLFYFFNYEEFRLPESRLRTRYLLTSAAQQGIFTYPAVDGSGNKTINLLTLAASKGQVSTLDPSLAKLLGEMRSATSSTGSVTNYDQNLDKYDFINNATQKRKFPTVRLDYNLTAAHRLSFVYRYNDFNSTPDFLNSADQRFPGFSNWGRQISGRTMWQASVRSTLGKNMVNEARAGQQSATGEGVRKGSQFGENVTPDMFNCTGVGCQSAGGKGWVWTLPGLSQTLTSATAYAAPSSSVSPGFTFEDNVSWMKGKHSISGGFWYGRITSVGWAKPATYSTLQFGTISVDPAYNMLDPTSGNFPGGLNNTYAGYARNLYGLLTGRVTSFGGTAWLQPDGSYQFQGENTTSVIADSYGFFVSDSWRLKPNLTVNAGVRWEFQLPMTTDGLYSRPETWQMVYGVTGAGSGTYGAGNLYKPGTLTGVVPQVVKYDNSQSAYNTDWNNLAPSLGVAWRPTLKDGFLSKILSKDPVFRGGYSLSFTKLGLSFFSSNYGTNPGRSRAASRTVNTGTPFLGSESGTQVYPVLLRDTTRLVPSAFPSTITYPFTPAANESVDIHYPDWPVPSTHQYSFGFQRALGRSMALEIRYVGNTNTGGWTSWNMNGNAQWSMLKGENGFYDEFRLAQQNLRSNIINGKGNTFAYTGVPGTSPLPIFMAFLQGIPLNDAKNQVAANYTDSRFANSSWYNSLNMYSPALTTIAGTGSSGLQQDGLMANAAKAGLPVNFFMANPTLKNGGAYLETSVGNTQYNGLQMDLRRQMSKGLLLQGSYSYSFGRKGYMQRSLREDWFYIPSTGGPDHAFKLNWAYELPFGQGKKLGSGAGRWKEALIGGWEIDGVARVQSGSKFDFGGFRLVGMTEEEFAGLFSKFYHIPDATTGVDRIYNLPKDVIEQSIIAIYTTSATTASGYAGVSPSGRYIAPASGPDCVQYLAGQCPGTAFRRIVTGPLYGKIDMSFVKRFSLPKNMKIEARMDLFNILNTVNFSATDSRGSSFVNWQVTSAATDANASQDPGGRITQFGLRFIW